MTPGRATTLLATMVLAISFNFAQASEPVPGSYPRVLGRYVRDQKLLSMEEAVHKGTALAAKHMGMKDRGTLAPGKVADLVLFDPDTIIDNATPTDPEQLSAGVIMVWVNGELVFREGQATGARPGRVVRRSAE